MQYYLSAYIEDCRIAEKYHEVSILFDNLAYAETYYNQFNGKEIYNDEILINDSHEIRYVKFGIILITNFNIHINERTKNTLIFTIYYCFEHEVTNVGLDMFPHNI